MKDERRREFELIAVKDKHLRDLIVFQNQKKKKKLYESLGYRSNRNINIKFNIGINEFNIDRMSRISVLRTLCTFTPDRWIELAKALGADNKSEGKKSGVRITSLRWMTAESHLITIEFEFSSNRWRRLLIFFSHHVSRILLWLT